VRVVGRRWEGRATAPHGGPLKELVLEGFDSEQVWEQLALHHTPVLRHLRRQALNLAKASDKGTQSFFPFVRCRVLRVSCCVMMSLRD
jgi:hypothetical protein